VKAGFVEGENGGEAMHLHGGYQAGIVRRLSRNPILNDEVFQTG
jgi:hypothetical protein